MGNTAGDLVVTVPDAEVTYTGNLIYGEGSIPWLTDRTATAEVYLRTVQRLSAAGTHSVIVPGHGPITNGAILDEYATYLSALISRATEVVASGSSLDHALVVIPYEPSPKLADAPPVFPGLMPRIHAGNVELTFRAVSVRRTPGTLGHR